MKRFFAIFLCLCLCFLAGCENETKVLAAHISDMTGARSTDYAIKVVLDDDERVNDKFVDVQIMSSNDNQTLTFGQELQKSHLITIPKKDYWYNLTYLISNANGVPEEGKYQKYEEYGDRVYMFSSSNDVKLKFRVVVGQVKVNKETNENILVLSEDISEEVEIEVKKAKE